MKFNDKINKLNVEMSLDTLDASEGRELETRVQELVGFYTEKVDKAMAATHKLAKRRYMGRVAALKYGKTRPAAVTLEGILDPAALPVRVLLRDARAGRLGKAGKALKKYKGRGAKGNKGPRGGAGGPGGAGGGF